RPEYGRGGIVEDHVDHLDAAATDEQPARAMTRRRTDDAVGVRTSNAEAAELIPGAARPALDAPIDDRCFTGILGDEDRSRCCANQMAIEGPAFGHAVGRGVSPAAQIQRVPRFEAAGLFKGCRQIPWSGEAAIALGQAVGCGIEVSALQPTSA